MRLSNAQLLKALEDGEAIDVQAVAKTRSLEMLAVLIEAATDESEDGAPWSVRTRSAKDVLEIADGKPATKETEKTDSSLTIVINQLFQGGKTEKVIDAADIAVDVEAAIRARIPQGPIDSDQVAHELLVREDPHE